MPTLPNRAPKGPAVPRRRFCHDLFPAPRRVLGFHQGDALSSPPRPEGCRISEGRFAQSSPLPPEGCDGSDRAVLPFFRRFIPKESSVSKGRFAVPFPLVPEGACGSGRAVPRFPCASRRMRRFREGGCRNLPAGIRRCRCSEIGDLPALSRRAPRGPSVPGRRCLEFPHAPEGMRVLSGRVALLSTAMPEGLAASFKARRPFPFGPKPLRIYSLARPRARRDGPGTVVLAPEGAKTCFA